MPKPTHCVKCGKEYDSDTFLVKLKSNGQTYRSWQCRKCAVKDANISEIIETPIVSRTEVGKPGTPLGS